MAFMGVLLLSMVVFMSAGIHWAIVYEANVCDYRL